jgi:hypothetical protein
MYQLGFDLQKQHKLASNYKYNTVVTLTTELVVRFVVAV